MNWNSVYKIKDSIDVYLVDDKYMLFYFMNTRARKKFAVNETVIALVEEIDGEHTSEELYESFSNKHDVTKEDFAAFIDKLLDAHVLIEKLDTHILTQYIKEI